jgi:hypothetical protein
MGSCTFHVTLSFVHVACVVFAIVVSSLVFNKSIQNKDTFMTNTFYSSANPSDTGIGWPVSTKDVWSDVGFTGTSKKWSWNHYYICMAEAGFASQKCSDVGDVGDYADCLQSNNETSLVLAQCSAFSSAYYFQWPTSGQYTRCLTGYPVMGSKYGTRYSQNTFKKCLDKIEWPSFETVQDVDSQLFLGSYNWGLLASIGLIIMTSFGVFTAYPMENGVLEHDEPQFFCRMGLLWSAISFFWNVVFLIVFLVMVFKSSEDHAPMTLSTSVIGTLFLLLSIFYFMDEWFGSSYVTNLLNEYDQKYGVHARDYLKNTAKNAFNKARSTIHKAKNAFRRGNNAVEEGSPDATATVGFVEHHHKGHHENHAEVDNPLGGPIGMGNRLGVRVFYNNVREWPLQKHKEDAQLMDEVYVPPLITSWSDGYFADCLIFVGVAGASGQVETDLAWTIFWLMLLYRLLNAGIARFIYECFLFCGDESYFTDVAKSGNKYVTYNYLYDSSSADDKNNAKADPVDTYGLDLRVLALSSQISSLYIFLALSVIFTRPWLNASFTFQLLAYGGFIVPEAIRIALHVILQSMGRKHHHSWVIVIVHEFLWAWDLAWRSIVLVNAVLLNNEHKTGTYDYLYNTWEGLKANMNIVLTSA